MNIKKNKLLSIFTIVALILSIVLWGTYLHQFHKYGGTNLAFKSGLSSKEYIDLKSLQNIVDKYYYKDTENVDFFTGMKKGLVESLGDPYSEYLTPKEFSSLTEQTSGSYVGVGVVLSPGKSGLIEVVAPIDDTPAFKAGLKPGDQILSINGKNYTNSELSEAVKTMKGAAGEKVVLKISDTNHNIKEITIVREKIKLKTVSTKIVGKNIGYIRISSFDDGTGDEFRKNLTELLKKKPKSLVIDVRSNPGGIVPEVLDISDMLLDKGMTIVTTKDRQGKIEKYMSENPALTNLPMVVLMDSNSASASEILAGALKDNKKATLIGETSYGKGLIQTVIEFNDDSALKITIAQYYTPSGDYINEKGINPDIKMELDPNKPTVDTQLNKAIDYLEKNAAKK